MLIRPRLDADLPRCVEVLARVREHGGYPSRWPEDPAGWLTPKGTRHAWVAENDAGVIGHVLLVDHADTGTELSRLFVDPDAQRTGAARALVEQATQAAFAYTASLELEVLLGAPAVEFYRRLGWTETGRVPASWLGPDGRRPTAIRFRRTAG